PVALERRKLLTSSTPAWRSRHREDISHVQLSWVCHNRRRQGLHSLSAATASSRELTQSSPAASGWSCIHPMSSAAASAAGSRVVHRLKKPPSPRNLT